MTTVMDAVMVIVTDAVMVIVTDAEMAIVTDAEMVIVMSIAIVMDAVMTTVMSTVMAILMDPVMDYGNEVMRRIGCFTFCLYIGNRMAVSPQLELEIVFGYKLFVLSWQASTICQYSRTLLYMGWQMPFLTF